VPRLTGPTATGVAGLIPYSNTILGAIQGGATVSDIWAAVRGAEAEGGPLLGNPTIFDMNYVAGQMRAINSAQIEFGRADPSQAVTSEMWAWAPWATQTTAAWGEPSYQLRYQYEVTDQNGTVSILWGQTDWQGSIDVTTGDIGDRALGSAQSALDTGSPGAQAVIGDLSGAVATNITAVQILRV
jgi:hypothetical protein